MEKANKAQKGLKCCADFLCSECPYAEYQHVEYKLQCIHKMHMDLVEALESKAVVHQPGHKHYSNDPDELYCPNCNKFLGFVTNHWNKYCSNCGQALKYKEE